MKEFRFLQIAGLSAFGIVPKMLFTDINTIKVSVHMSRVDVQMGNGDATTKSLSSAI
jgi:hypothetical protein